MCNPNLVDQLGYIMSCGVGDIKLLDVAVEARMFFVCKPSSEAFTMQCFWFFIFGLYFTVRVLEIVSINYGVQPLQLCTAE